MVINLKKVDFLYKSMCVKSWITFSKKNNQFQGKKLPKITKLLIIIEYLMVIDEMNISIPTITSLSLDDPQAEGILLHLEQINNIFDRTLLKKKIN